MTRSQISEPVVRREAVGDGFRVREIAYPRGIRQAPHAHERTGITLVLGGRIRETVGRKEEIGRVLSLVVKPAGVIHADEVGPEGARTIQLLLDPDLEETTKRGIGGWRWSHGGSEARALLGLYRLLRGDRPGVARLGDRILEVLGEMVEENAKTRRVPPVWLERAREALDDSLPAGLRVRDLATLSGVHPVSLARAFRRHYGVSVSEYKRRERVRRAALEIEGTAYDLTRVAYRTGFADHPHMCREIRQATGLTPTELREMVRRARV